MALAKLLAGAEAGDIRDREGEGFKTLIPAKVEGQRGRPWPHASMMKVLDPRGKKEGPEMGPGIS